MNRPRTILHTHAVHSSSIRNWRKIENGQFTARGSHSIHAFMKFTQAEIITAFSDCLPETTNKGYDVFDTPALALSPPLRDQDEVIDEEEKIRPPTPDIVEESPQDADGKGRGIPQAEVKNNTLFNPPGSYQQFMPFERTFIDLGRLMTEEGFDLVTSTQVQDFLSDDWKFA